jgi:heat shock protein 5
MVAEAEKFASEDEAQRKRIEALNSLSSFVYGLKTQLNDQAHGYHKETMDWIDENGSSASDKDLEEKLAACNNTSYRGPSCR